MSKEKRGKNAKLSVNVLLKISYVYSLNKLSDVEP